MRKIADDLTVSAIPANRCICKKQDKLSDEKLQDMLDAETWLSADEAF
ncbi:hypothetical protein [Paenibacillus larvae]|nr:hypothetical protein [Paenibacillus larvae]MDT2194856.1 hypothetical protein [Paenibacillus larvae]